MWPVNNNSWDGGVNAERVTEGKKEGRRHEKGRHWLKWQRMRKHKKDTQINRYTDLN